MRYSLLVWLVLSTSALAAGRRDWRVPPVGIEIAASDRAELTEGVDRLGAAIEALRTGLKPELRRLVPDVEVFHKAVEWALVYGEFYRSNEVAAARRLLESGLERATQLQSGEAPWLTATGLVVRGYISRIDDSVQPYGLVVPGSYRPGRRHRLDVWLHGRDDHLTELKFIDGRLRTRGQFTPPDTIVLHPYGRFCNGFKFAGEMDVLEAMDHVRREYGVDRARVSIRGFSMGGAGCWHLAVHHAGIWAAAAPGAGFAETAEYSGISRRDPKPPEYERRLWHWYDATDYAANLFQCPTIAYSGEQDKQKQAVGDWVLREMTHATNEWRSQFRGFATVKEDTAVTDGDIAGSNLVLWGDPAGNRVLARIMAQLPVRWGPEEIELGGKRYSSLTHLPVLIYPNPLNPKRYVVLNSGFTFCEMGEKSNSLQTPKLPDYAVIDMRVAIARRHPEGVVWAGFFDEEWR